MNNLSIYEYRQKLIELTNNCGLTIGSAYFVVKDLAKELEENYYKAVEAERNQPQQTETQTVDLPKANTTTESIAIPTDENGNPTITSVVENK